MNYRICVSSNGIAMSKNDAARAGDALPVSEEKCDGRWGRDMPILRFAAGICWMSALEAVRHACNNQRTDRLAAASSCPRIVCGFVAHLRMQQWISLTSLSRQAGRGTVYPK